MFSQASKNCYLCLLFAWRYSAATKSRLICKFLSSYWTHLRLVRFGRCVPKHVSSIKSPLVIPLPLRSQHVTQTTVALGNNYRRCLNSHLSNGSLSTCRVLPYLGIATERYDGRSCWKWDNLEFMETDCRGEDLVKVLVMDTKRVRRIKFACIL